MIRGISSSSLVLVFCFAAALSPGTVNASAREDIPRTALHQGKMTYAVNGAVYSEMDGSGGASGVIVVAEAKPGKSAKRSQKFIDEDGDGYNDRGPDTVKKNAAGDAGADQAKAKNASKSGSGAGNAGGQGLKKGQGNNPGLGIEGALERGIKKSRNSNGNSQNGLSNTSQDNIKNNGKNRFDRNFEKYDRSSREMKGEGSGRNE